MIWLMAKEQILEDKFVFMMANENHVTGKNFAPMIVTNNKMHILMSTYVVVHRQILKNCTDTNN